MLINNYKYIDTHSHLHDKAYDEDRDDVIEKMKEEGIFSITVGTDFTESKKAVMLAEENENIFATVGMHPVDNREEVFDYKIYKELSKHKKVVAIGECGLDYFRLDDEKEKGMIISLEIEKERQKNLFQKQITLATEEDLPLMLHGRPSKGSMDAYEDMLDILESVKKEYGAKLRGNAHFFVGNTTIAKRFLEIGFTMSFSGVITFAKEYEEVIKFVPLSMLHAETDSPYATPVPHRGKRNSPAYVKEIIKKISELKNISESEAEKVLLENAKRLFSL